VENSCFEVRNTGFEKFKPRFGVCVALVTYLKKVETSAGRIQAPDAAFLKNTDCRNHYWSVNASF